MSSPSWFLLGFKIWGREREERGAGGRRQVRVQPGRRALPQPQVGRGQGGLELNDPAPFCRAGLSQGQGHAAGFGFRFSGAIECARPAPLISLPRWMS